MFTVEQVEEFKREMVEYREENCQEEPGDNYFYGELTQSVESKEKLLEMMITAVLKYMICYNYRKHQIRRGLDALDGFFEHDSLRENYFDHLLHIDDSPKFFEQVKKGVLDSFPAFTETITPSQVAEFKKEIQENFEETGDEVPADEWFYGYLPGLVESKEQLMEIMTYAITKYLVCLNLDKDGIDEGLDMLQGYFEHDENKQISYFAFLIPENKYDDFSDQVKKKVLKNLEEYDKLQSKK